MSKKIIALATLATISTVGITSAFANSTTIPETKSGSNTVTSHKERKFSITEEERSKIQNMSAIEQKAYFQQKHTEMQQKRQAQESVIDKLLAGEKLTAEEEKIRQEIISLREERKAKKAEMGSKGEKTKEFKQKQHKDPTNISQRQTMGTEQESQQRPGKQKRMQDKNQNNVQ